MTFGAYVKGKRGTQGLSLRAAASRVGIDPAHLSRVEAGKTRPSEQLVERLAPVIGCSANELALMAGYLPPGLRDALEHSGSQPVDALRQLAALYVAEPTSEYRADSAAATIGKRGRRGTAPDLAEPANSWESGGLPLFSGDDVAGGEAVPDDAFPPAPAQERVIDPRNRLNALTSTEWIPETVSVWTQRGLGAGHPDAQIERQHPAPFSFTDVARLVRFFSKPGETVLDPFVGVGSTLKACALEGRCGIGIELNPKYAKLARERLRKEVRGPNGFVNRQCILEGDARTALKSLATDTVDFIITSPPYWNILHKEDHKARQERKDYNLDTRYSDDERDLGNTTSYPEFLRELTNILGEGGRVLKRRKYMAIVVSDFRDRSQFIMFHADLASSLAARKFGLRGLKVLYQRHKKIFPYGYPYAYVPNIHHQYILILQNER